MATELQDRQGHEYDDDWRSKLKDGWKEAVRPDDGLRDSLRPTYTDPSIFTKDGRARRAGMENAPSNDPSDPRGEYDPQKTPLGDSSDPRGDLAEAEAKPDEKGSDDAASQESAGLSDRLGKGFTGGVADNSIPAVRFTKAFLQGRKGKAAAGGGIIASIIVGIFMAFMSLVPLKLMHMVNNMQDHFFASSLQAAGDMTDNLLRHYITKQLVPGMAKNNCTTTRVTKSCANTSTSNSMVGVMYNSWRDANLEGKLADRGIEIRREGNRYFMTTPNIQNQISLGEFTGNTSEFEGKAFKELSKNEVRREMRTAFEKESLSKRIMFRYSVGGLLERKYKIRRCITACETRDKLHSQLNFKKRAGNAFKMYFAERVLIPRTDSLGLVVSCAFNSFDCVKPSDTADENGERTSQFEQNVRAKLEEHKSKYGQSSLDDLHARSEEIKNKGFVQYAVSKLVGELGSKIIVKGIPVVGWIDLGAKLIQGAQNAGPAVTKMAYVINSTTMVSTFAMYATTADEIKTGNVDATVIGSMSKSLDASSAAEQGGGGAEASPIYDEIMNGGSGSSTASLFTPSVFAAGEKKVTTYKCDDGKSVPEGQKVCPEETLGNVNGNVSAAANGISDVANSPMFTSAGFLAGIWNNTMGWVLKWIQGGVGIILDAIPGMAEAKAKVGEIASSVVKTIITWIIPSPVNDNSSGARRFNVAAGGADVSGNDFAHYGQGGQVITDGQANKIRAERKLEEQEQFKKQSTFARLFDTDSKYSMVSRIALATPSSWSGVSSNIASIVQNPVNAMSTIFSAIFRIPSVNAQTNTYDPFGVTQYGYLSNDKVFVDDPEEYWITHDCDNPDNKKNWGNQSVVNENTQIAENTTTNGCMLLRSTISSAGGKYNTDLLENSDKIRAAAADNDAPADDSGTVSGDDKELAKKILNSNNVTLQPNPKSSIEAAARGEKSPSGVDKCGVQHPPVALNSKLLGFLLELSQVDSFTVTSLTTGAHSCTSNHYKGVAADFGCDVDVAKADIIGKKYGISHNFESCSDSVPHWHYSIGGR